MRKKRNRKESPCSVFGRIVTQEGKFQGQPFIKGTSVKLDSVLRMLHEDKPDREISARLHIPEKDIDLCRAWQVCFQPETLVERFTHMSDPQNTFMLDENSCERMLYDVARLFGRSSHVRAKGLTGACKDDESFIWAHLLRHDYKAILTADADFRYIAQRHRENMITKYGSIAACPEPVPVVIFYDNQDTPETTVHKLERNRSAIQSLMKERDVAYATLTPTGILKCALDSVSVQRQRINL